MSKRLIGILLCIAAGLILTACGNKETVYQSQRHWTERMVAVVAPIGDKTSKSGLSARRNGSWTTFGKRSDTTPSQSTSNLNGTTNCRKTL